MSGFCLHLSGPETRHILLHLLLTLQARFLCGDSDYFWDSGIVTVKYIDKIPQWICILSCAHNGLKFIYQRNTN